MNVFHGQESGSFGVILCMQKNDSKKSTDRTSSMIETCLSIQFTFTANEKAQFCVRGSFLNHAINQNSLV